MSENLSEVVGQDVNLEAPQEEQAAQEQPQEAAPEQPEQQEPPRERVVPLEALHEERARRKEMQAQIQRLQQEQAQRDRIIEERLAALARQQAPEPSFEDNPAEALRRQLAQVQQGQQMTAQQLQHWQQSQQQEQIKQQLVASISTAEASFAQQQPDYVEAVQFLRSQRIAELQVDGMDEYDAAAQATRELQELAFVRASQGKNAAEVAYKLAKARGYSGKQIQQQLAPQEKLQAQQRGVAASRSLGSGGAPQNKITAETLASMSDDEFADLTKGDNWRKIMGA